MMMVVAEEEEAGVELSDWIDKIEEKLKHEKKDRYHMQPNKASFVSYMVKVLCLLLVSKFFKDLLP